MSGSRTCHDLWQDEQIMGIKHSCVSLVSTRFVIRKVSSTTHQTASDIPTTYAITQKGPSPNIKNKQARFFLPFYLVADFEAFLPEADSDEDADKNTRVMNEHNVCGFACYCVSQYPEHEKEPFVYSGSNVMDKFYDHTVTERSQILNDKTPMDDLDDEQQAEFDRATECYDCNEAFTEDNYKVRHHDHVSGKYIAPACRDCNINVLKFQQRKRKATQCH